MNFWIGFYTAHPNGTGLPNPTADQILIAARSTTAGDMVGVAIDGNIGTLKGVAGSVLIGDGLFLNNEGPATLGGIAEPGTIANPPLLQGSPFQVFTLTIGTDTFHGSGNGDQFNAPLSGVLLDEPTLTDFDNLTDSGINAVLNAVFDGDATATGVNIVGIPTWNIQNHVNNGTVVINSGGSSNSITGLKTLNYNANGGSANLEIGTVGAPIAPAPGSSFDGFAVNVMNALGTGHVDIAMAATGFKNGDAITVTAQGVGTGPTNGDIGDENQAYDIAAGSPTAGFTTWHVKSLGPVNNIGLGADGSHAATTVFLTDAGSGTFTTLWAATASGSGTGDWQNVTTLDASGTTGFVFITGAENGPEGFLHDNNAITNLIGGSGRDLFDLSSRSGNGNGISINGGGNLGTAVELNSDFINAVSAGSGGFALWTGVPNLWDLETQNGHLGGTIDMSRFPGTNSVRLFTADSTFGPDQSSDFLIKNAPSMFEFNFQDTDQHGHNVEFDAVITGGQSLTVDYFEVVNSTGQFLTTNFANVLINTFQGPTANFYSGGVKVEALVGDPSPITLTFDNSNVILIAGEETSATGPNNPIGTDTLTLVGGNIVHPTTGTLDFIGVGRAEFGVTNAHDISSKFGSVEMSAPGNDILFVNDNTGGHYTGVTVDVAGGGSQLQGSLGFVTDLAPAGHLNMGGIHEFAGNVGTDSITDTGGSTAFFGDGGMDTLSIGHGHNNVWFGAIALDATKVNGDNPIGQIITDNQDHPFQGFWGVGNSASGNPNPGGIGPSSSTSADITTISGFDPTSDTLHFNSWAWAGGGVGKNNATPTAGSLVTGDNVAVGSLGSVDAVTQNLTAPGAKVAAGTDFVLYNLGLALNNASDLASALSKGGIGDLTFNAQLTNQTHMLFAYLAESATGLNDLRIADVDFLNGTQGATHTTVGAGAVASDIADLGTGVSLLGLGINPTSLHFNIIG
jgi:hypothetical protein